MIFPNQLIKYGLLFLLLPIILQLFGFIEVSLFSMFSFASFFIGLTIFYYSFGTKNFLAVFFGSGIFFTGVFSFLIKSFLLDITFPLIVAGSIYITGFSLLMVFIENAKKRSVLYVSGFLIFTATMVSLFAGNLKLRSFFASLPEVLIRYWLLLLMAVITVLLLYFEQRQSRK
ncbi:MAG: hypothetical protein M0P61_08435 [Ignavibacteriaceae bacterium]|jgi:hypothetical protein|nr:hypothetical protein [Ignavibacteriaceae bacterium]